MFINAFGLNALATSPKQCRRFFCSLSFHLGLYYCT